MDANSELRVNAATRDLARADQAGRLAWETRMEASLEAECAFEFNSSAACRAMTLETEQRSREKAGDDDSGYDEVIDAKVMRITGAGHLVVYPVQEAGDVEVGDPVKVIVPGKGLRPHVSLELREDTLSLPISSRWAIVVSLDQSVAACRVFYNHMQLNAIDHLGHATLESRVSRDEPTAFHIPDYMEMGDGFLVEVRDGDLLLRTATLGEVRELQVSEPKS
jgi:hypothetical protein